MNLWSFVRSAVIGFAGISSAFSPVNPSASAVVGWEAVAVGFVFFPVIVFIGLGVLLPFSRKRLKWRAPSWNVNPFDFSQPEQFFHMAGYGMLAIGAGSVVAELWGTGAISASAMAPAAIGVGVLVGLQLLGLIARRQGKPESKGQHD